MTRSEYYKQYTSNPEKRKRINYLQKQRKERMKINDPVKYKATILINGFKWGKGGCAKMIEILNQYLGKPCKYCGVTVTLENCSVDHKTPYAVSSYDKRKQKYLKTPRYTPEQVAYLTSPANLHIICNSCNRTKSNMTDEQYVGLLSYLDSDLELKTIILSRLKRSNMIWGRR